MSQIIASFEDIDIYPRDFINFNQKCWLNDSCLSFCLKRIQFSAHNEEILVIEASVASFLKLQCESQVDFDYLEEGLSTRSKSWILLPINDLNSALSAGGSHWSLLLCDVKREQLYHFDSSNGYNNRAAREFIPKLSCLLNK